MDRDQEIDDINENVHIMNKNNDKINEYEIRSPKKNPHYKQFNIYFLVFFTILGGFLFGYDTGVISGAMLFITPDFNLTPAQKELVVSIALVGSFIGALTAGIIADRFGRRVSIGIASIIFIVGSGLLGIANGVTLLVIGRIVVGYGVGIASNTVPVFIAEVAPSSLRGSLVTTNILCVTGGQFISYVIDGLFSKTREGWRWMLAIGAFPAFLQWIGILFLVPESPRWLLSRGKNNEGKRALCKIRESMEEVESEIREIKKSLKEEKGTWKDIIARDNRYPLLIGVMLQAWQQFVGINTVMYYSATILKDAFGGKEDPSTIIWFSLPIAGLNMVGTIIAIFLIDRVGRKPLLLSTLVPTCIGLITLGLSFHFQEKLKHAGYFALASLLLYILGFSLGMGSIPWTINSEIYPSKIRARCNSVATAVNWVTNYIVAATFISYQNAVGKGGVFWTYAGVCVLAIITIFILLPETKGKSIEEILELFKSKGRKKKNNDDIDQHHLLG